MKNLYTRRDQLAKRKYHEPRYDNNFAQGFDACLNELKPEIDKLIDAMGFAEFMNFDKAVILGEL